MFIAVHLSARLQSMFSVGRVGPQLLSHLEMQLKVWLVCKHLSHLGMQLKDPVYKKLCTLAKVDYSQHCSSTSHLIVTTSKRQNPLMKLSKKELGD